MNLLKLLSKASGYTRRKFLSRNSKKSFTIGAWSEQTSFKSSGAYWIERYAKGNNSGSGSYGKLAAFKAEIINDFVNRKKIDSVIEWGCGDGNQLKYFNIPFYTGFDISPKSIEICRNIFGADKSKEFFLVDDYKNQKADLSLSLDVLFHLVENEVFHNYMENLFDSSSKYVLIYSSNYEIDEKTAPHVKHRTFTDWIEVNKPEFTLIEHIPNKYPFDPKQPDTTSYADFYIFEKTI